MNTYEIIDGVYQKILENYESNDGWLLLQTILTGQSRRKFIETLPLSAGQKVLDIGTGFGALAIDLAGVASVTIDATDIDEMKLGYAEEAYTNLQNSGLMKGEISFHKENAEKLSYPDNTFDVVVTRFVFQHLPQPEKAAQEILRVLKPGGVVCIEDIDDAYVVEYPVNESYERLKQVHTALQKSRGGDRQVGRKLPTYLHEAGFEIDKVEVMTYSDFLKSDGNMELQKYFLANVFMEIKNEAIAKGLIDEQTFEEELVNALQQTKPNTFQSDARLQIIASKK